MKKILALASVIVLFTACKTPLAELQRAFPDGASVRILNPSIVITATGGTFTSSEISWIGTNGYPFPDNPSTNVITTQTIRSRSLH